MSRAESRELYGEHEPRALQVAVRWPGSGQLRSLETPFSAIVFPGTILFESAAVREAVAASSEDRSDLLPFGL